MEGHESSQVQKTSKFKNMKSNPPQREDSGTIHSVQTRQSFKENFQFSEKQIEILHKRFLKLSVKGHMTKEMWRDSLGILGLDNACFLADSIFSTMCKEGRSTAEFDDFLRYMNALLNGTDIERARQSFNILDSNGKGYLNREDFEKMIYGVSTLWNSLTGSKIVPRKEYIDGVYLSFTNDENSNITFEDFFKSFKDESKIFSWFEFFNQDDLDKENTRKNNSLRYEANQKIQNNEEISECLSQLDSILSDCFRNLNKETERISQLPTEASTIKKTGASRERSKLSTSSGPLFNSKGVVSNISGDCSPDSSPRMSGSKKGKFSKANWKVNVAESLEYDKSGSLSSATQSISLQAQSGFSEGLLLKLRSMLELTQEIKRKKNEILTDYDLKSSAGAAKSPGKKSHFAALQDELDVISEEPEIKSRSPPKQRNSRFPTKKLTQNHRMSVINMPNKKKEEVKKNISIYFGHENWNLMLNMMIGIRTAVKSVFNVVENQEFQEHDYKMIGHYDLIQKRTDSFDFRKACKFFDYAPGIFERIRLNYGVTNEEYLVSIGPENMVGSIVMANLTSLTEQMSTGKSGSFFYFSQDGKFVLKTISKAEFILFKKILKPYFLHLMENPDTLMTRMYGLHKMKVYKSKTTVQKIYFIVMGNLFKGALEIEYRYDLKGSEYGRTSRGPNKEWDPSIALKDLDFLNDGKRITLKEDDKAKMMEQIKIDCEFFQRNNIIDYSLLVGVHNLSKMELIKLINEEKESKGHATYFERNFGGIYGRDKNTIYLIGIIDILTGFGMKKKLEHSFKRTFLGAGISCVPPQDYANRFMKFMAEKVF